MAFDATQGMTGLYSLPPYAPPSVTKPAVPLYQQTSPPAWPQAVPTGPLYQRSYSIGQVVPAAAAWARNQRYLASGVGANTNFNTILSPQEELVFQRWVKDNNVPFNPNGVGPQDYDMRGFYKGLMTGDPHAQSGINTNDGQLHYSDYWKTPYHQSFSAESQWANPQTAPRWNNQDQLVAPDGTVVYDERAQTRGY